ncbi:MAG: arabinofuranosidase catalytic domain-containing protein, partial [Bacteroidales bacterium]
VNQTGNPGQVNITIDLIKAGIPNTADASNYALLIDSDEDFTSGAIEHTTGAVINSGKLTFTSITFSSLNYISIAIEDIITPGGTGIFPELWYKPDMNISLSGSEVSSWTDNSIYSIEAVPGSSGSMPDYLNNPSDRAFNFQPYLSFNGSSDRLSINLSYDDKDFDQVVVFTVFKTGFNGSSYNDNWAFLDFDRSEFFDLYVRGDNGRLGFSYTTSGIVDAQGLSSLNDDVPHLGLAIYDNTLVEEEILIVDGAIEGSSDNNATGLKIGNTSNTRYGIIGDGSEADVFDGSGNNIYYNGEIAEILYFKNEQISNLDLNKIQTYLSLKYGITLSMPDDASTPLFDERDYHASNNTVLWDYSDNIGFTEHITGIGRDDKSGLLVNRAVSTKVTAALEIEKTSTISSDLDFAIVGDNGESGQAFQGPESYPAISKRIWKADLNGNPGSVDLSFDLATMDFNVSADPSDFALLMDNDGDFTSGATVHLTGLTLNGDTISFSDVPMADGQYFALAASGVSAPGKVINDLNVWLRADKGVENSSGLPAADGESVTVWRNSKNDLDYTAVPGPTLEENTLNFNPSVDIISGGFNAPAGSELSDDYTLFFVSQKLDSDIDGRLFEAHTGNYLWNYHDVHWRGIYQNGNPSEYNSGVATTNGTSDLHLVSFIRDHSAGTIKENADGTEIKTWNGTNSAGGVRIDINQGAYSGSQSSDSRIGEMIIYNTSLSDEQVDRVESYLSIKYGITKDGNFLNSDGDVIWNATANTGYLNYIAGIGRDDASELDQSQSKSIKNGSVLTIESEGGFSDDLSYIITGSNGETGTEAGAPAGYRFISSRIWKANVNGNPGTVKLSFDLNTSEILNTANADNYALLIDSDDDFTTGAAEHTTGISINGNELSFNGLSLADGQYFTLVLKDIGTPADVESIPNTALSLRRVVDNYSGPAVRVRRSSDNAFQDIGFTAEGFLDTTSLILFAAGNDLHIVTWYDQSGNGNYAYQSDQSMQPLLVSGGSVIRLNGKPGIQFDGNDDGLDIYSQTSNPTNDFSI